MSKKTQTSEILSYLQNGNTITSMEAIDMYGATRLSSIIFSLKKQGFNIHTEMIKGKNRFGDDTLYGRYTLIN